MSQTYIFHDQAGTIPGVPGTFSHCQVEVGDDGQVTVSSLPGGQNALVVEATLIEPVAEVIPQEPPAMPEQSIQEQPVEPPIESNDVQEVVPEPENTNQ